MTWAGRLWVIVARAQTLHIKVMLLSDEGINAGNCSSVRSVKVSTERLAYERSLLASLLR